MATFPFRSDAPARQRVLLMAQHMFMYPSIIPDTFFSLDSNALTLKASSSGSSSNGHGAGAGWTRRHRPRRLLRAVGPFPLGAHGVLEIAVRALRLRFAGASASHAESRSVRGTGGDPDARAVYEYVLTWRAPGRHAAVVEVFEVGFVGRADAAGAGAGANRRAAREALMRLCEEAESETAGAGAGAVAGHGVRAWLGLELNGCSCVVL